MKNLILLFSLFLSTQVSAQANKLLSKIKSGDTLNVNVERTADMVGLYDKDLIKIVKTKESLFAHSDKRGRWYKIDKEILKSFQDMEKEGLKLKNPGLKYDTYQLSLHGASISFQLPADSFREFMALLK
jgi:hypothetical protein